MNDPQKNEQQIFLGAIEIDSEPERNQYLDRHCGGDTSLRDRMDALIAAHFVDDFLSNDQKFQSPLIQPTLRGRSADTDAVGYFDLVGKKIGPYDLLRVIGQGGMGVVFHARQTEPIKRDVAIKIIKPGMDSQQVVRRFKAEQQALALMDHENIATVFDAGTTHSALPYFVMELVEGTPITDFCDEQKWKIRERLTIFISLCSAIQHAHHKGVIHRDIKPSNVLVTWKDQGPVLKVIDFGIAKATRQSLNEKTVETLFGQLVGTPQYMSPEQAELNNVDIDTRTDIYSMGVLLYELVTGSTPVEPDQLSKASFEEILQLIREQKPARLTARISSNTTEIASLANNRSTDVRRLAATVKGEIEWIVGKALEKDRQRRYQTAGEFADDIQKFLNGEAIQAGPPSVWYAWQKTASKHKIAISVAALLILILISTATFSTWQAIRANQALAEKNRSDQQLSQQQAITNQQLSDAIRLADSLEQQLGEFEPESGIWQQYQNTVQQVELLSDRDQIDPALKEQAGRIDESWQMIRADLQLLRSINEARWILIDNEAKNIVMKSTETLSKLDSCFREYEIHPETVSSKLAATHLRGRPKSIHIQIVGAFDEWLFHSNKLKHTDEQSVNNRQWIERVLRDFDDDETRRSVRSALKNSDYPSLQKLAQREDYAELEPYTLALIGSRLCMQRTTYSDGMTLLLKSWKHYPDNYALNYWLAKRLGMGRNKSSIGYASILVALRPNDVFSRLALAIEHRIHKQYVDAEQMIRSVLELDPENVIAFNLLGANYSSFNRHDLAEGAYEKALEIDPNSLFILQNYVKNSIHLGKIDQTMKPLRRGQDLDPENQWWTWMICRQLYADEKYDQVVEELTDRIDNFKVSQDAHLMLANALTKLNKNELAKQHYQKASLEDPGLSDRQYFLSMQLRRNNRIQEAIDAAISAAELDPVSPMKRGHVAGIYYYSKDYDNAKIEFEKTMQLEHPTPSNHLVYGYTLRHFKEMDQATASFKKAFELAPQDSSVKTAAIVALRSAGDYKTAIEAAKTMINFFPLNTQYRVDLAKIYMTLQRFDEAEAELKAACQRSEQLGLAWAELAAYYERIREFDQAEQALRMAIKHDPKDVPARLRLAMHLLQKGETTLAIQYHFATDQTTFPLFSNFQYGQALLRNLQFVGAAYRFKESAKHVQGRPVPGHDPMKWNKLALRLVELDPIKMFPKPDDQNLKLDEAYAIGMLWYYRRGFARAIPYFEKCVLANPAIDIETLRIFANCAVRAAHLTNESKVDLKEKEKFLAIAHRWLSIALNRQIKNFSIIEPGRHFQIARPLQLWWIDREFAPLHDPKIMAKLSPETRDQWREFWKKVESRIDVYSFKKF